MNRSRKIGKCLARPCVPSPALSEMPDCSKNKLRRAGYPSVYHVEGNMVFCGGQLEIFGVKTGSHPSHRFFCNSAPGEGKDHFSLARIAPFLSLL